METGRIIYRNTRSFDIFKLGIKEYLTTQKEKELWGNICAVNRDKEGSLLIWQIAYLNYNFLICQQESNKEKAESERRKAVEEMIERQNIIVTKKYPLRLTLSNLKGYFCHLLLFSVTHIEELKDN